MKTKKMQFLVNGKNYEIYLDSDNVTLSSPITITDKKTKEEKEGYKKTYHGNIYQALQKVIMQEELSEDHDIASLAKLWRDTLEDLKKFLIDAHGKFPLRDTKRRKNLISR